MNIYNNTRGGFCMAIAPSNSNQVLIFTGLYGCLKVLANSEKYFNSYYPDFYEFDHNGKKYRITNKELKESFIRSLNLDMRYTNAEFETLAKIFKIKVELLAEKKRAKNYQTGSSNRANDKQRKAKAPGKRISATGRAYTERRANRSDKRPKYKL